MLTKELIFFKDLFEESDRQNLRIIEFLVNLDMSHLSTSFEV